MILLVPIFAVRFSLDNFQSDFRNEVNILKYCYNNRELKYQVVWILRIFCVFDTIKKCYEEWEFIVLENVFEEEIEVSCESESLLENLTLEL